MAEESHYTMAQAARLKGVSYHTVSRAVRRGKLPARRLGRQALIAAGDLAAWTPMRERAPKKYRRYEPDPEAVTAQVDLATLDRADLEREIAQMATVIGQRTDQLTHEDLRTTHSALARITKKLVRRGK